MKRSHAVVQMARYYGLKAYALEHGELDAMTFFSTVLEFLEESGMSPPFNHELYYKTWREGGDGRGWEEE